MPLLLASPPRHTLPLSAYASTRSPLAATAIEGQAVVHLFRPVVHAVDGGSERPRLQAVRGAGAEGQGGSGCGMAGMG